MKWVEGKYGFEEALVGRARLTVGWDSTGPKGTESGFVANLTISGARTKLIASQDEAKAVLVSILRRTCEQILNELPPKEKP